MKNVEILVGEADMKQLVERCRFAERFMALCRECGNYGTNWACPPFDFDVEEYLENFEWACLFGVRWTYDEDALRRADTPEKAAIYSHEIFWRAKQEMLALMFRFEERYPGSLGISAGGCSLCETCARADGISCRSPEKIRHSAEALGFDVVGICREWFGLELCWSTERLPDYQVLVNALFAKKKIVGLTGEVRNAMNSAFSAGEGMNPPVDGH